MESECGWVARCSRWGVSESGGTPDAMVDPRDINVCECDTDDDCGEFQVCDTESTDGRLCSCAAYENAGSGCVFLGAPADPGFQATDVWTATDSTRAMIEVADPGNVEPGLGRPVMAGTSTSTRIGRTSGRMHRDRLRRDATSG